MEQRDKNGNFILKGNICYSTSIQKINTIQNGYLICKNGVSEGVYEQIPSEYIHYPVYDYSGQLIIPGMVDMHIHAPQYAFRGIGMDLELMEWLEKQAFPEEMKYEDIEYAAKAYEIFGEEMKKSATTRACIFATKHRDATEILMDCMESSGLISFVGKVNMDRNAPPALCEKSAEWSAYETFGWINDVLGKYHNTYPILTPRFVPCCSDRLLEELREIQIAYDLPVQSHLSENLGEIQWVKELTDADFYGDAYDRYGLFGVEHRSSNEIKTVMAHCVYSTDSEIARMKEDGVFIAHCPASNMNLSSGIAPIRKYIDAGIQLGLGSDVAGGHTNSIFRAIAESIQVSKLYWRIKEEEMKPLNLEEAFYMATKGGGAFFGKVGSFEKGYEFDAIVLNDSILPHPQELSVLQRLERAIYLALDINGIAAKYVAGRKITPYDEND